MTNANETRDVAIHGDVEDGYGAVADEFRRNFRDRHDLGAGCAVYVDGRQVVDLWAGVADRRSGKPFEHDTARSYEGAEALASRLGDWLEVLRGERPLCRSCN